MRILFVNDHVRIGGKEKYIDAIRKELKEAGHVTGLVHSVVDNDAPVGLNGIQFWVRGLASLREFRPAIERLREVVDLFKPDVIHIHNNPPNHIVVNWLVRRFPVLRSVHDVEFVCPTRYYIRKDSGRQCDSACGTICFQAGCLSIARPRAVARLVRTRINQRIYARGASLSTQSEYVKSNLLAMRSRPEFVSVLPVFVDSVVTEDTPLPTANHFVFSGRLNHWKGPDVAIEALSHVDSATLEILGSGAMLPQLQDLVRRLKLESRVRFSGFVEGSALVEKYTNAIAVVLPSRLPENCPMAVQDAMAAGRAVISTRTGGIPALVDDGVTGLLVPPNDSRAVAAAMEQLMRDRASCETMGRNGRIKMSREEYQRGPHLKSLVADYERAIRAFAH